MNKNQFALYAFLANTVFNLLTDNSDDKLWKRIGKAALNSIPMSLEIDTKEVVDYAAKRYDLGNIQQPSNSIQSVQRIVGGSSKALQDYVNEKNLPAYYSSPETAYKNLA